MNDQEYRYFYEVAKTLNFSQAAESLYISQPALSHCISKLEQEFQTLLFVRSRRDIRLTRAGQALLDHYPLVQQANRTLCSIVHNAAQGVDVRLNVGIQEGHIITPSIKQVLKRFQANTEGVDIQVSSYPYNELFDRLIKRDLDLAFSVSFPDNSWPDIEQRTFEHLQSYALVSNHHPAAQYNDPTQGLRMLDGLDLMLVEWTIVPNVTSFIFNQCLANGFTPSNIRYAPNYFTLYDWLVMEQGFVIMDKGSLFREQDIHYIPLQKDNAVQFCVYWHKNGASPAVKQFLEQLPEQEGIKHESMGR